LNFSVAFCTNYFPLFNEVQINTSGTSNPKSQEKVAREANKEWWQEYDEGEGRGAPPIAAMRKRVGMRKRAGGHLREWR
jgi:hypothetical protein